MDTDLARGRPHLLGLGTARMFALPSANLHTQTFRAIMVSWKEDGLELELRRSELSSRYPASVGKQTYSNRLKGNKKAYLMSRDCGSL